QTDREKLRQELLSFQRLHAGTRQAVLASGILAQLTSPLDRLDPEKIPALERFDWQPKELVAILGEHRGRQGNYVYATLFTPGGKTLAAGVYDSTIHIWDISEKEAKNLAILRTHQKEVTGVAYSPDGKSLASVSPDQTIRVWDMTGEQPKEKNVIQGPKGFR